MITKLKRLFASEYHLCSDLRQTFGARLVYLIAGTVLTLAGLLAQSVHAIDSPSILYSNSGGSASGTTMNWTGSVVPTATDVAQFGANPTSGTTGVGINFNATTNGGTHTTGNRIEDAAAVEVTSARAANLIIGNSSSTAGAVGKFRLKMQQSMASRM